MNRVRTRTIAMMAALLVSTAAAVGDTGAVSSPSVQATGLELVDVPFARGVIHLDASLLPHQAEIVRRLDDLDRTLTERRAQASVVASQRDSILAAIEEILGVPSNGAARERWMLFSLLTSAFAFPEDRPSELWIVTRPRARAHLAAGGALPSVVHTPGTGEFTTEFEHFVSIERSSDESVLKARIDLDQLTLPLAERAPIEDLDEMLEMLAFDWDRLGTSLVALLTRVSALEAVIAAVRPSDPHHRWFTDGLAGVVAVEALRRVGLVDDAGALDATLRAGADEQLRRETMLRFWTDARFKVDVPLDWECTLDAARHGFAYLELERLVDAGGDGFIAAVIEDLQARPRNPSASIARIVDARLPEGTTPSRERLRDHQLAISRSGVRRELTERLEDHRASGAVERVASDLIRLSEVGLAEGYDPAAYALLAAQLQEIGYEREAVALLQDHVGVAREMDDATSDAAVDYLLDHAIRVGRPWIADQVVDDFLLRRPDRIKAHAVRAHRLSRAGWPDVAAAHAALIQSRMGDLQHAGVQTLLTEVVTAGTTGADWVDLLDGLDVRERVISGVWRRDGPLLVVQPPARFGRLLLPVDAASSYELSIGFWRLTGDDAVVLVLPVRDRSVTLVIDGWPELGGRNGLAMVDGRPGSENPTTTDAFGLINRHQYTLHVVVETTGDQAAIHAFVDSLSVAEWSGPIASLSLDAQWTMGGPGRIGLGCMNVGVAFDAVRYRARPDPGRRLAPSSDAIRLAPVDPAP